MHFDLTEEQKHILSATERVLRDHVDTALLTKGQDETDSVRAKLKSVFTEMGLATLIAPEENGGLGLGLLGLCALSELFGEYAAPSSVLTSALAAWVIAAHGTPNQKEVWLDSLLEGRSEASFCLNESPGVWSPDQWTASTGDSTISKTNVENAAADVFFVGCREGFLLVGQQNAHVLTQEREMLDVTRPLSTIEFDTAGAELIGDVEVANKIYDALLALYASDAAGAGHRSLALAVEYAGVRKQFDETIGSFQGVKHQLANMAVDIEPAKFLCWYAAHLWDLQASDAPRMIALAKAHATDVATKTARASVEVHGGIGYTWEYPLHLFLKRAMFDRMVLSSPRALREKVAQLSAAS